MPISPKTKARFFRVLAQRFGRVRSLRTNVVWNLAKIEYEFQWSGNSFQGCCRWHGWWRWFAENAQMLGITHGWWFGFIKREWTGVREKWNVQQPICLSGQSFANACSAKRLLDTFWDTKVFERIRSLLHFVISARLRIWGSNTPLRLRNERPTRDDGTSSIPYIWPMVIKN